MYNRAVRHSACFFLAASISTQTLAQSYCADPTASPCIQAKQNDPNRRYQISQYIPYQCDDEINAAGTAWRNAGSYFSPTQNLTYYNSKYVTAGVPEYQIVFNTALEMGKYGTDNAVTFYGRSVAGWKRPDGVVIPVVDDADIVVNGDKHASGTIECSATVYTDRYDLTRTMAHEFGHVVGLNHNTNTACATYQAGQKKAFDSLCTPEKDAAKLLYGTKP